MSRDSPGRMPGASVEGNSGEWLRSTPQGVSPALHLFPKVKVLGTLELSPQSRGRKSNWIRARVELELAPFEQSLSNDRDLQGGFIYVG